MSTAHIAGKPSIKRTHLAAVATLVLATLLAYHNSFLGPFVFDDGPAIVDNRSIRDLGQLGDVLSPGLEGGVTTNGRPIVNFSFAVNYAIHGYNVRGYHGLNLLIHLLAGLAFFGVVRRTLLLQPWAKCYGEDAGGLALAVSALWLLHPLQTSAVTYVVQRAESLCGLFYLTTLYAFIRAQGAKRPHLWLGGSILSCLAGMGTKEVMVSAPLLVLLYDRTFISGTWRQALLANWRYYTGLACTWLLLAGLLIGSSGRGSTAGFETVVTPWHYLLTQCGAVIHYLRLTVIPTPLIFDYGFETVGNFADVWWQTGVLLLLAVGTTIALWRQPALGFVGFWFFAILAPSSSFVPIASQTIAEHRMYLPLAAPLLLMVVGLRRCVGRWAKPALWLLACVFLCLTTVRNRDYASELALWGDTVAKQPGNSRAYLNLGRVKLQKGLVGEAIADFETARLLAPRFYEPEYDLGLAHSRLGHQQAAIEHFQSALTIQPTLAEAHLNLANALFAIGRSAEAGHHFELAVSLKPNFAPARSSYGNFLVQVGRPTEALHQCETAIRLQPDLADAHFNAGNACIALHRLTSAVIHFQAALSQTPDFPDAHNNLANALVEQGRFPEAIEHYQAALRSAPNMIESRRNLALLLMHRGRPAEARPHLEALSKLLLNDPEIEGALLNLQRRD